MLAPSCVVSKCDFLSFALSLAWIWAGEKFCYIQGFRGPRDLDSGPPWAPEAPPLMPVSKGQTSVSWFRVVPTDRSGCVRVRTVCKPRLPVRAGGRGRMNKRVPAEQWLCGGCPSAPPPCVTLTGTRQWLKARRRSGMRPEHHSAVRKDTCSPMRSTDDDL